MASWLADPTFQNVVKEAWDDNGDWVQAVQKFQSLAQHWNRECYGNLFRRKRRLLARLEGINLKLSEQHNPFLHNLQKELWRELDSLLLQEEVFWFQKARKDWLQYGDRNTKFFHSSTLIRRKRNKIEALRKDDGEWTVEENELMGMATTYYKKLYHSEPISNEFPLQGCFPPLAMESLAQIQAPFSCDEIKQAVFSIGAFKVPGPDGLHPIFFQTQWDVVGESVCNLVQKIVSNLVQVTEINETLIVLIPKLQNSERIKDF